MSPVSSQVATAATMTTPREIAVFWTTESMVIGPVGRRVAPGAPVARWPAGAG